MANIFWVGTGTWDNSSTANWRTSSGGTTPATNVPGSADVAVFDANSGACTLGANVSPGAVNQTDYTNTLTGTGFTINLTGTGTVWTGATTCTNTNVSCDLTTNTATARTVSAAAVTETNAVNFTVSAGTGQVGVAGSVRSLVITSGFTGSLNNSARTIFGDLTVASGATLTGGVSTTTFSGNTGTRVIRTNGVTLDFPLIFGVTTTGTGAWQLFDNLTVGSARSVTFTVGTLDLNGKVLSCGQFLSSNTNTRTLTANGGSITATGSATVWSTAATTGLTITTPFTVTIDNNTATAATVTPGILSESQSLSFNFISGSYALTFLGTASHTARNVTFASGFTGSWTTIGATTTIFGSLTLGANMSAAPSSVNILTFGATSGTYNIRSNGKTLDVPITFNAGTGGTATWTIQDPLSISARACTLSSGTLNLNGTTMLVGSFTTASTNAKTLALNGGILTCAGSGSAFNNAQPATFTSSGTTGTIQMSSISAKTFVGGGDSYNAVLQQAGTGTLTITGANTFQDIQATSLGAPSTIALPASTTTTVAAFSLSGTTANPVILTSSTGASQATLYDSNGGTNSVSNLTISYINADTSNGTVWNAFSVNGNTDGLNNTGWSFIGVRLNRYIYNVRKSKRILS
jgi:hypothetical protein